MIAYNVLSDPGITLRSGAGSRVENNSVNSTVANVGINIELSPDVKVCSNVISSTGTNMSFLGNCAMTELSENTFVGGSIGLFVDNIISEQLRRGNKWTGTYSTIGAQNDGPTPNTYPIRVNPDPANGGDPDYSTSRSPTFWFDEVTNPAIVGCYPLPGPLNGGSPEIDEDLEYERIVEQVTSGLYSSTPISEFEADIYVSKFLDQFPDQISEYPMASSYLADAEYEFERKMASILSTYENLNHQQETLDLLISQSDLVISTMDQITLVQDMLKDDPSNQDLIDQHTQLSSQLFEQRSDLNQSLLNKKNFEQNVYLDMSDELQSAIANGEFEENLLLALDLLVSLQLDPDFTLNSSEEQQITDLAYSCSKEYGVATHFARSVHDHFLAEEASSYPDYFDCESSESKEKVKNNISKTNTITLYPNPGMGQIHLRTDDTGDLSTIRITSLNGIEYKVKWTETYFDATDLPFGTYIIEAYCDDGEKKVGIFHHE